MTRTFPTILIQNESKYIKLGDFKERLGALNVEYKQIHFTKGSTIFIMFDELAQANTAMQAIATLTNYKKEPYRLKLVEEFEPPTIRANR